VPVCVCAVSVCGWKLGAGLISPFGQLDARIRGFTASVAHPSEVG